MSADRVGNSIASWMFLLAGIAMLMGATLIPVADELTLAEAERDRALALERHRADRLERYRGFLSALDAPSDDLVISLAADQLRLTPPDRRVVSPAPATAPASVFAMLEPPPMEPPTKVKPDSAFARLVREDRARLAFLAIGGISVLIGVFAPFASEGEPVEG